MNILEKCPTCRGTLVNSQLLQSGAEDGELVLTETTCRCAETDTPGFVVTGEVNNSNLSDTLADILNKVNDNKQKLDEIKLMLTEE